MKKLLLIVLFIFVPVQSWCQDLTLDRWANLYILPKNIPPNYAFLIQKNITVDKPDKLIAGKVLAFDRNLKENYNEAQYFIFQYVLYCEKNEIYIDGASFYNLDDSFISKEKGMDKPEIIATGTLNSILRKELCPALDENPTYGDIRLNEKTQINEVYDGSNWYARIPGTDAPVVFDSLDEALNILKKAALGNN